jgi:hypothetical protein
MEPDVRSPRCVSEAIVCAPSDAAALPPVHRPNLGRNSAFARHVFRLIIVDALTS